MVKRGFPGLPCIGCRATDTVLLCMEDLSFSCSDCDETYTIEDVLGTIQAWQRVIAWLEQVPPIEEED